MFMTAAAIKEETDGQPRLCALLTHCLGLEGQQILATLEMCHHMFSWELCSGSSLDQG